MITIKADLIRILAKALPNQSVINKMKYSYY